MYALMCALCVSKYREFQIYFLLGYLKSPLRLFYLEYINCFVLLKKQ